MVTKAEAIVRNPERGDAIEIQKNGVNQTLSFNGKKWVPAGNPIPAPKYGEERFDARTTPMEYNAR